MSNKYQDATMYEVDKQLMVSMWSPKFCERHHGMERYTLVAVNSGATTMRLEKMQMKHPFLKLVCLWSWRFGGCYYQCRVYKDLSCRQQSTMLYRESFMSVTHDVLEIWKNWLPEKVMEQDGVKQGIRTVPEAFCTMRFLNGSNTNLVKMQKGYSV